MQGNYKSGLGINSPTNTYSAQIIVRNRLVVRFHQAFSVLLRSDKRCIHHQRSMYIYLLPLTYSLTPTSLTTRCSLGLTAIGQIFTVINEQSQASFDENFNWISYYNWTGGNGALSPAVNNAVRCGLITKLRSAYLIVVRRVTASRKAIVG